MVWEILLRSYGVTGVKGFTPWSEGGPVVIKFSAGFYRVLSYNLRSVTQGLVSFRG